MTKKEILQQLADGHLSKKQASEMLSELEQAPVYSQAPAQASTQANTSKKGCLIIAGLILLIILSIFILLIFFKSYSRSVRVTKNVISAKPIASTSRFHR